MKVIAPVRFKRKRVQEAAAETTAAPETAAETAAAPATAPPPETAETALSTRGLLRKSAIRRFLKNEFAFPLQIRDAFFAAADAKFAEDLRRSVTRARASKRNTLMAPDA